MRKYGRILAFVLIVALVLAAVAGCGSSDDKGTSGNQTEGKTTTQVFNDAKTKMADVESFRTQGTLTILMDELEGMGTGSSELEIPFEAEVASSAGDQPNVHMTIDLGFLGALLGGGESLPGLDSLEMYIVDETVYMNIMGEWYFTTAEELGGSVPADGDISKFLDITENPEVVDETGDYIEYEVTIDAAKLADILEELDDGDTADLDALGEMLQETVFTVKVDKDSGYPIAMSFTMVANLDDIGFDMGGGLVPSGDMTVSLDATFSGFGEDVKVELPAAAEDALPFDELFNSFFGSSDLLDF
ncbi:MAG: hypothetical protein ACYC55_06525 [Candidatus Geothermincolia bacterium]